MSECSINFGHCTCSGRCFYLDVDNFYGSVALFCTAYAYGLIVLYTCSVCSVTRMVGPRSLGYHFCYVPCGVLCQMEY